VRNGGHPLNPFRLGLAVGHAGIDLPAPYLNLRSVKLYDAGLRQGREFRQRMIAEESAIP
jgi:hypothetical protein